MKKPHILLITADELRKDSLGCYGNRTVKTAHLDRLAAEALQFESAYSASPWCLPSRCAILTGQLPHNSGAYSNFRRCELAAGIPNLFTELKRTGYRTSVHGKCHFAPVPYETTRPDATQPYEAFRNYYLSLGIDWLDLQDDKQVSVWFRDDYAEELDRAGYLAAYRERVWDDSLAKVFPFPAPDEWHPDRWVGRKAAEYIDGYNEEEPLFCWVSFSGPHYPFDPPESYMDRVDMSLDPPRAVKEEEFADPSRIHHRSYYGNGRGIADGCYTAPDYAQMHYSEPYWHSLRKSYYANVALLDDEIGAIVDCSRRRWGDDILIIFTADHGEMLGNHGIWGKGDCGYEDVLNVPLLVQYPGDKRHRRVTEQVQLTDLMPTCLQAAGADSSGLALDGADLHAVIAHGGHPYVFSEGEGFITVSDGRMKYIQVRKQGREHGELFDRLHDPLEFENVIDRPEYAAALAELRLAINNLFMHKLLG
ncbi:sulfatase-like hydrolase/transferase [Cohnella cellulosilytica]|uniref:Sulfatase-like hydrolase/transferase n=1 Tax=Cohnella cellulosilytica TaxID=986710 RepID=A0ABW2FFE5_9BACL